MQRWWGVLLRRSWPEGVYFGTVGHVVCIGGVFSAPVVFFAMVILGAFFCDGPDRRARLFSKTKNLPTVPKTRASFCLASQTKIGPEDVVQSDRGSWCPARCGEVEAQNPCCFLW